jgi:predicted RNase H-like HicB family nuclease
MVGGRAPRIPLLHRDDCNKLGSMNEIVFEVTQESDGGFVAECLTESIITQADDWEELRKNVKEAVAAFYFDQPERPSSIRLHLVRDEILAYA